MKWINKAEKYPVPCLLLKWMKWNDIWYLNDLGKLSCLKDLKTFWKLAPLVLLELHWRWQVKSSRVESSKPKHAMPCHCCHFIRTNLNWFECSTSSRQNKSFRKPSRVWLYQVRVFNEAVWFSLQKLEKPWFVRANAFVPVCLLNLVPIESEPNKHKQKILDHDW